MVIIFIKYLKANKVLCSQEFKSLAYQTTKHMDNGKHDTVDGMLFTEAFHCSIH